MNAETIVRAAIPNAIPELCSHILWAMTCFPFGKVTARDIYRSARRYARARANGIELCELCDRKAETGKMICTRCDEAMSR